MSLVKVVINFFLDFTGQISSRLVHWFKSYSIFFGKIAKYLKNGIAQDLPKWLKLIPLPCWFIPYHSHFTNIFFL